MIKINEKYGRWLVRSKTDQRKNKSVLWDCICECGSIGLVGSYELSAGRSKSCGCLMVDLVKIRSKSHGKSNTPTYMSWLSMKRRCLSKKHESYDDYGYCRDT